MRYTFTNHDHQEGAEWNPLERTETLGEDGELVDETGDIDTINEEVADDDQSY